jgi:hypothetical protein
MMIPGGLAAFPAVAAGPDRTRKVNAG